MKEARTLARAITRIVAVVVCGIVILVAAFAAWASRPSIAAVARPRPSQFSSALVERGRALAMIGNCASCHTTNDGPAFAGGVPISTGFGTIYGSNITPDESTGIGRWSEQAFARALREGVSRDGQQLYPAFPYDHFTELGDTDIEALYAFLMSRPAVHHDTPGNRLILPLRFRPFIEGWKWLYFRPHRFTGNDPGAYFAEALAHCGACHTPHNSLGAELRNRSYSGGWVDGWYAPPLNQLSPAVRPWTADALNEFLRTGLSKTHAAAAGPMGEVSRNLSRAPPAAVGALAAYFARNMQAASANENPPSLTDRASLAQRQYPLGAALFAGACSSCHEPGARMMTEGRPALALGSPLHETNPRNTIAIILDGLSPPASASGPYMPAFGDTFTDQQVADIVTYLHARFGSGAEWQNVGADVGRARKRANP